MLVSLTLPLLKERVLIENEFKALSFGEDLGEAKWNASME